jgi:hypothetical protein
MRGAAVGLTRKSSPHKGGDPITVPTGFLRTVVIKKKSIPHGLSSAAQLG